VIYVATLSHRMGGKKGAAKFESSGAL